MVQNPFLPEGSSKIGNPFAVQEGYSVDYMLIFLIIFIILLAVFVILLFWKKRAIKK
jgi:hypothetical protein